MANAWQLMPLGGGVPIMQNNVVVGAVGVGGAENQMEIRIAEIMAASYGIASTK